MTKVIIGAGLGDEGKGLITDYFSDDKTLVIRFNGGGQAAHTVVTPEGIEHVFHHIGSGSFRGAATFLSKFFIVNPLVYMEECEDFIRKNGSIPDIYVSPECVVSTPYDSFINVDLEKSRGDDKHGSCGIGINETIVRSEQPEYCIRVKDLSNKELVEEKLEAIRTKYVIERCKILGIDPIYNAINDVLLFDGALALYQMFNASVIVSEMDEVVPKFNDIVFEGAQGLLLDEGHEWFPHVTRSKTGLDNVLELAASCGIDNLDIIFVSRCYSTRHGAGPFPHEMVHDLPYPGIEDPSNPHNSNQGKMRYGYLDLSLLETTIKSELVKANGLVGSSRLALTCLDQLHEDGYVRFMVDEQKEVQELPEGLFDSLVENRIGIPVIKSFGRTRDTIRE